jgi:hypothetical protein
VCELRANDTTYKQYDPCLSFHLLDSLPNSQSISLYLQNENNIKKKKCILPGVVLSIK